MCCGFAEYLDIDGTLVRLIWVMLIFFGGWGLIGYLLAWIIVPVEQPSPAPSAIAATQPAAEP